VRRNLHALSVVFRNGAPFRKSRNRLRSRKRVALTPMFRVIYLKVKFQLRVCTDLRTKMNHFCLLFSGDAVVSESFCLSDGESKLYHFSVENNNVKDRKKFFAKVSLI